MTERTRVSVVIPCYNREKVLPQTLDSLRDQTFADWEAIIVDDASTDDSLAVAESYGRNDVRFRPAPRAGSIRGANVCRNQGLRLARGAFVIFLDSDDLLAPGCLEHRVARMDRNQEFDFGVFQTELFTNKIGDLRMLWNVFNDANDLLRFLSLDTVWLTTGPIWRTQAVRALGGFDENVLSYQDWDIHVRAMIAGLNYFKHSRRDSYHRHRYTKSDAVSAIADISPEHLRSHERLFEATFRRLEAAKLLETDVRHRVAGLFWWLTERWRSISSLAEADRVWAKARSLRLCSFLQYLEGRAIFRSHRVRGGGRFSRFVLRTWPRPFHEFASEYLCKTLIEPANVGP